MNKHVGTHDKFPRFNQIRVEMQGIISIPKDVKGFKTGRFRKDHDLQSLVVVVGSVVVSVYLLIENSQVMIIGQVSMVKCTTRGCEKNDLP